MEVIVILALILFNGVLAMSEIALVSARKSRLETDARKGSKQARKALRLASEPNRFLSTVQIGITLVGILTGLYSGEQFADNLGEMLAQIPLVAPIAFPLAQSLIILAVTYLTLILGELVPKRIGMTAAEKVAKIVASPMLMLSRFASPFVWLLTTSTNVMLRLLHISENKDTKVTEEEIKAMIQEGRDDGEVQEVEQDIVERVFNLGDRDIASIMTHRSDLVWIDIHMTCAQIKTVVAQHTYNYYPVSNGAIDKVVGVLYLKDIFGRIDDSTFDLQQIIRPPHYFPETLSVYSALEKLKQHQLKQVLVTDEFGTIQGVVTLTDIVEALVGNVPDRGEEPDIFVREDGSVLLDGQCPFYDFLAHYDLADIYAENKYNTVSGLILELLHRLPQTGEKIEWLSFSFEIVDMDGARIDKILVSKQKN